MFCSRWAEARCCLLLPIVREFDEDEDVEAMPTRSRATENEEESSVMFRTPVT